MELRSLSTLLLLLASSCATPTPQSTEDASREQRDAEEPSFAAPPLEHSVSILTKDGRRISLRRFYDELASADIVFLGETHIDETTHRVELGVYDAMISRRDEKVVLGMEMFERDAQSALDAYLAGTIDESTFLERSTPWSNYHTSYRPLIELAREHGLPVVASNFPRSLRMRVAREGLDVLQTLEGEERHLSPGEILPNTPAYWRRTDNAIRGHIGMMGGPPDPDDPRLDATQTLWDNAMGEGAALAYQRHEGHLVLHVNGGFHSAYWDGTVRQCRLRAPDAKILTVEIVPSQAAAQASAGDIPDADYTVVTQRFAQDLNEGQYAIYAQRPVRYRLHMPKSASDAHPVPLLLWLSDDGLTSEDAMALWKERLGTSVAIAVFDPPYREILPDQSLGGRWFWIENFDEDSATVRTGIEGAYGYLLRHFPIDTNRVCLAGEGTGATIVAETALLTGDMNVRAVALGPRRYSKIKDNPLPLPEESGPRAARSLEVFVNAGDEAWWSEELGEYDAIGLAHGLRRFTEDPWFLEFERENALRSGLEIPERPAPTGVPAFVEVPGSSVRARLWARERAIRVLLDEDRPVAVFAEGEVQAHPSGEATRIPLEIDRATLLEGKGLPVCPGPFGGTTVLLVPAADLDAWLPLEENDPLNARSRFFRTRIAVLPAAQGEEGASAPAEHSLPAVLRRLLEKNRKNVLIVPATFHAGESNMRALVRSAASLDDQMTLHWLPGLGG